MFLRNSDELQKKVMLTFSFLYKYIIVVWHQVIWSCLVEDSALFLRFFLEKLTREQQDVMVRLLRRLVRFIPRLPSQVIPLLVWVRLWQSKQFIAINFLSMLETLLPHQNYQIFFISSWERFSSHSFVNCCLYIGSICPLQLHGWLCDVLWCAEPSAGFTGSHCCSIVNTLDCEFTF